MRGDTEPRWLSLMHLLSPFVLDKLNFLLLSAGSGTLSVSLSVCCVMCLWQVFLYHCMVLSSAYRKTKARVALNDTFELIQIQAIKFLSHSYDFTSQNFEFYLSIAILYHAFPAFLFRILNLYLFIIHC